MLTIFSIPKPFVRHIGIIQRNAINSWRSLHPSCEVILFGDEPGTEEVAAETKARYFPKIARNEYGTPLLDHVFAEVQKIASQNLICYVNTDIILLSDFLEAIKRIRLRRFLAVGQRWDMDITQLPDFRQPDWEKQLHRYIAKHAVLHQPWGSDYFVYPRDSGVGDLPPFAVGRPGWDNWLIYNARKLRIPVVDITRAAKVIHQNHGYGHVSKARNETWEGPEGDRNRELAGDLNHVFTSLDATHLIEFGLLLPAARCKHLRRRWQTLPILYPSTRPIVQFLNTVSNCFHLQTRRK